MRFQPSRARPSKTDREMLATLKAVVALKGMNVQDLADAIGWAHTGFVERSLACSLLGGKIRPAGRGAWRKLIGLVSEWQPEEKFLLVATALKKTYAPMLAKDLNTRTPFFSKLTDMEP